MRSRADEADVRRLIDGINRAYPRAELVRSDVRLVHRGLLPAVPNGRELTLSKATPSRDTLEGLLSVVGVKYTTAATSPRRPWIGSWPTWGNRIPLALGGDSSSPAATSRASPIS